MQAPKNESFYARAACGGLASMSAEFVTIPMDVCKVRLQLNAEGGGKKAYNGIVDCFIKVFKSEGLGGLYKGLSPALLRQAVYSSARMAAYEPIRDSIAIVHNINLGSDGKSEIKHKPSLIHMILAGGTAGAVGASIANPTDVLKIQMQADKTGTRYRNLFHGFQELVGKEGFRGMYRGVIPNIQRAYVVNAAELATYDKAKQWLIAQGAPDNIFTHGGASFSAGFVAAVASTPVDLCKTRLMNQPMGPDGKGLHYKGMWDCMTKTAKHEGIMGLYKGFTPTWMRIGPWAMVMFTCYEQYRNIASKLLTAKE